MVKAKKTQSKKTKSETTTAPKASRTSLKGMQFVDKASPWRIFEITLPNGETIQKRFRRKDPVAVVIAKDPRKDVKDPGVKFGYLNHWTSNMKAAMHLAEKILAGHKEVQLLDGDDIRFVKEESPKERTSKKTKKAEPSKVESEIS